MNMSKPKSTRRPGRAYIEGHLNIGYNESVKVSGELADQMRTLRRKFNIKLEDLI